MMFATGSAVSRPRAATLSRRSRSVMMPIGTVSPSTRTSELIPWCDISCAAAWMEMSREAVTTGCVIRSPTAVVNRSFSPLPKSWLRLRMSVKALSMYLARKVRWKYSRTSGWASSSARNGSRGIR